MGTNCKFMMWWSLIDVFSFASNPNPNPMHNCIACIHVLHFSLGLFPVVLLLLWVRLTAGRSHRLPGSSKRLRGLWSSWAKVNRIELNDPGVWASSRHAVLSCDLAQVRRMPGRRRRSGSWWRSLESPSFPHLWGKEYCRMTTPTVLLQPDPGMCVNVSKWSLQNLFLMEPTDVMWCPSLSVLELYCRLML